MKIKKIGCVVLLLFCMRARARSSTFICGKEEQFSVQLLSGWSHIAIRSPQGTGRYLRTFGGVYTLVQTMSGKPMPSVSLSRCYPDPKFGDQGSD